MFQIERARLLDLPLLVDADGLFLVGQDPAVIKNYPNVMLTPNVGEVVNPYFTISYHVVPYQTIPYHTSLYLINTLLFIQTIALHYIMSILHVLVS
jgi:hypothetical protein